jgi:hypothetical protein
MKLKNGSEVEVVTNIMLPTPHGTQREYYIVKYPIAKYLTEGILSPYAIIPKHEFDIKIQNGEEFNE